MHTQINEKKRIRLVLPGPLASWVDEEAERFGMSRNSYVTMRFQQLKDFNMVSQIQNLGVRVTQLEHKFR